MPKSLFVVFSILVLFSQGFAQESVSQVGYIPPKESARKNFLGAGRKFSVQFAAEVKIQTWDNAAGQAELYTSELVGSKEIVRVQHFRNLAYLKTETKEFLEPFYKDVFGYIPEVESEKEITFKGESGFELRLFTKNNYAVARILKTKSRIYFLVSEVENWHLLKSGKTSKIRAFNESSRYFLNSLKFLKSVSSLMPKKDFSGEKIPPDTFSFKNLMFESPIGGFRVHLSGRPFVKTFPNQNEAGSSDRRSYTKSTENSVSSITYFDLPGVITDKTYRDLHFENEKKTMVSKFNLKLVSESDFRSSNRTGREFVFAGDGSTTRMQIFFVDRRVFVLAYLSKGQKKKMRKSKDKRHNRAAQKFFDSFEVTGIPVT